MAIKHVVFDWDGTLADTYPSIYAGYVHTFNSLGHFPIMTYDEIKKITSSKQNKDTMAFIFGEDKKDLAKKLYYEYMLENHTQKLQLMPNAYKLLKFCHDNGIKIYLVTNKRRKFIIEETDKLEVTTLFSNIVAAGDFAEDKPHPTATHAAFGYNLPEADEIMVVGDGTADYRMARTYDTENKKSKCVIYDPNNKYAGDTPEYLVKDLNDIIKIIGSENIWTENSDSTLWFDT